MIDELKTDYKDDVLATSQQGKRTFNIVGKNGEILFEDVHIEDTSRYLQVGDEYGSDVINDTNEYVNQMDDKLDELIEFMDNGVKAEDVTYNDSNVKLALDTLIPKDIASITRNGTTFTAKNSDGDTLFTFNQQDNNTTYSIKEYSSTPSNLANFVQNTANGSLQCTFKFRDDNNIFGMGAKAWVRGLVQYQNAYGGTYDVNGVGFAIIQDGNFPVHFIISGVSSFSIKKQSNIKTMFTSLNFNSNHEADYEFGHSVFVLSFCLVSGDGYSDKKWFRVDGNHKWKFWAGSHTGSHSVDIAYIDLI